MDTMLRATTPVCKLGEVEAFCLARQAMLLAFSELPPVASKADLFDEIEATASAMRQFVEMGHA